jgi:3-methylfumaryl-CoA hydratase
VLQNEKEFIIDEVRCRDFANLLSAIVGDPIEDIPLIAPAWHWLYTHEVNTNETLGADGHPLQRPNGVPNNFTRRLWVGSTLRINSSLNIGEKIKACITTGQPEIKDGASGKLAFVTQQLNLFVGNNLVLTENRTGVYRPNTYLRTQNQLAKFSRLNVINCEPYKSKEIIFDEISLFRYSAIIKVTHRIHYDYLYATQVERFPSLVIHGPLLGQVLTYFALKEFPGYTVSLIKVQALQPNFLGSPIILSVIKSDIENCLVAWSENKEGTVTMKLKIYKEFL